MSQQTAVLITLILYKVTLIAIGFWASKRVKDEADFFLGGRDVGPIVSGFSYAASTSSAWVLLGFSGFVYVNGLSALWMVPGIWAGYIVMWLWVGPSLRAESEQHSQVTLTDYLVRGVDPTWRKIIAAVSTLLIILCFIFYIAAQFDAAAKAFVDQFNLSMLESVLLGAVIILIYCLLGGFWAVSVTDTLQGIVMAVVAIGLPLMVLLSAGGFGDVFTTLGGALPASYLQWNGGFGPMIFLGFVFGIWGIGLGPLGQPHLLSRLMAVRDDKARRQGFIIAMGWGVVVYIGMAVLALAGRALVEGGALSGLGDGEVIFYRAASHVLPPVLAGIVIAATLSAVMSTVDSVLLSAAAAVAHDLGFNEKFPKRAVFTSRLVMAAIAVLAVILTLSLPDTIFNRVLFAWSALGAAFGPVVVARVFGLFPSGKRIIAAILSGFIVTVIFYSYGTITIEEQQGLTKLLLQWAHLPGDPFERVIPWIIPLLIVFTTPKKNTTDSNN